MPRIARGLSDGGIYHVLNRGNGRQKVFHKEDDFAAFITLLKQARERHPEGVELSRFMQWLTTSHVRRYHRHYQTSGHVWQVRFKSFIIQEDAYLLTVARYIEGNPLRARLVNPAREWRWS
jgi:putative transposase